MLLHDAITVVLEQKAAEGLSPRTVATYRKQLGGIAVALKRRGVRHAAEVRPADLDACFEALARRGLAASTLQRLASTVREFFRVLAERGLVLRTPATDLPVPDSEDELPEAPLSADEVSRMIAAMPRRSVLDLRDVAQVELLYGCALRLRECLQLDVGDIDLVRRVVHVRVGKGGRDRLVPLPGGARGALKDYLVLRRSLLRGPDRGALFLSERGQRIQEFMVRRALDRGAERSGLGRGVHPHLLRHSIAIHLLRGGADVRHVQQFLGHASLETTKIYLRMVPGHLREEYDKAMPTIAVVPPDPGGGTFHP